MCQRLSEVVSLSLGPRQSLSLPVFTSPFAFPILQLSDVSLACRLAILIEFRVQKTWAQVEQCSGKKTRHTVYVNHTEL